MARHGRNRGREILFFIGSLMFAAGAIFFCFAPQFTEVKISDPNCTEDGITERKFYYFIPAGTSKIPAIGHDFVYTTHQATCEEEGYVLETCTRCDYEKKLDITQPKGHDLLPLTVVKPTCTEKGYSVIKCSRCDYEEKSNFTDPLDHHFEYVEVPATCTTKGYIAEYCTRCGLDTFEPIEEDPIGHDTVYEKVEATCHSDGYEKITCKKCSYEKSEVIPMTNVPIQHKGVHPTCTESGYYDYIECLECGYSSYKVWECYGHDYLRIDFPSTGGNPSYSKFICTICGDFYIN